MTKGQASDDERLPVGAGNDGWLREIADQVGNDDWLREIADQVGNDERDCRSGPAMTHGRS